MEQKALRFRLYASEAPIGWNKMSEDRPSKAYFRAFNFNGIELPHSPNGDGQFRATLFMKDMQYTYFKIVDTLINETTYGFVDNKTFNTSTGSVYQLGLDIGASYAIHMFEDAPDNGNIGVERMHLTLSDLKEYNTSLVLDDFLDIGHWGDEKIDIPAIAQVGNGGETHGPVATIIGRPDENSSSKTARYAVANKRYASSESVAHCYVFANGDYDKSNIDNQLSSSGKEFLILPAYRIERHYDEYGYEITGGEYENYTFNYTQALGNAEAQLQYLIRQKPNFFIGVYNLPVDDTGEFERFTMDLPPRGTTAPSAKVTGNYYYRAVNAYGFKTTDVHVRNLFSTKGKYNAEPLFNPNIGAINAYSFYASNKDIYGAPITPLKGFNKDFILSGGQCCFTAGGFKLLQNTHDSLISYGSQLPVNKEAYWAYYRGIEQSMNTAIKVSRDNAILGGVKGGIGAVLGGVQTGLGAVSGDAIGIQKGVQNTFNGIFNLAGSIVNHVNTKATFAAQIADARNSIQPNIMQSADSDLRNALLISESRDRQFLIKRFTPQGQVYANNLAFLFGVRVSNLVPLRIIKKMQTFKDNPCLYLELQSDFVLSQLTHYIAKKFPTMNNKLKTAIIDAGRKGYRIGNVTCDLTKEYTYDITE